MISPQKNRLYRTSLSYFCKRLWLIFLGSILLIFIYFKSVEYNLFGLFGKLPSMAKLENPKIPTASELYTADGVLLGRYFLENRTPVPFGEISPHLQLALLATEDIRFYEHSGIDMKAMISIFWYLARGEKRGGSTISQQLAKNLFKTRKYGTQGVLSNIPYVRILISKTKEWITAINLEKSYSKDEIITMYFNTVDFGSNSFGIKTASKTFFRTTPDSLNTQQAATLIGLLKAPTYYSPILNPENCLRRRNIVLKQMLKYDFLESQEYDSISKLPLKIQYTPEKFENGAATYFRSVMNYYLKEWCKANGYELYADGLKIYTTIDSRIQKMAEESLENHLKYLQKEFYQHWKGLTPWTDRYNRPISNYIERVTKYLPIYKHLKKQFNGDSAKITQALYQPKKMRIFSWQGEIDTLFSSIDSLKYYKKILHGSLMAMEPTSGYIKAWVGGINYKYFKYDHVKQAKRQPGSTFKPFIYTVALDKFGYSPCDRLTDTPLTIRYEEEGNMKSWSPHNADWVFSYKPMTLRYGMSCSINTIAAKLTKIVGWKNIAEYARNMGITSPLKEVPSIGLGSSNVSLFEMVGAYGTFLNDGIWTAPTFITRIEDRNGHTIFHAKPRHKRAMSQETAFLMLQMFKGSLQEPGGTSGRLYRYNLFGDRNEIGGKTGTSSGHADGWYLGLTKDLVTGVWVGGDDLAIHFRSSEIGEGSKLALPIFGDFMEKIYESKTNLGITKGLFPKPNIEMTKPFWCPTGQRILPDSLTKPKTKLILNSIDNKGVPAHEIEQLADESEN